MPNRTVDSQQRATSEVISTADIEGVAVYDREGHKLGRIDHLIIDKRSGQVRSVVLMGKGFLGLGHTHANLPWASLKYSRALQAYVTAQDK